MKIAFTVCNRHQIRHALALGQSLLRHNPSFHFIIGWTDRAALPNLPAWVELIQVSEIDIADWQVMNDQYFDFEFVAACKPFFARFILINHPGCNELMYLAPTTWILHSLDSVTESQVFLQLTPHRLEPITNSGRLDDKAILNMGMFHAGSWVLHPDGQEIQLLEWWAQRTTDRAFFNLCQGMCLDQLWMNYLPTLFKGVQPIRNPGWHFGLHAVPNHRLSVDKHNGYQIDGQILISVDFGGTLIYHPVWSDHGAILRGNELWMALQSEYQTSLRDQKIPVFDFQTAPLGKTPVVKSLRKQRKRGVDILKKLIHRIETFDLTHE